ncbi:MAG: hypothetical protein L3K06_08120 [Thermoplasmata archaeon]|nr:hypothetical protein [Thermoplasmata archaeon]MCI4355312.1 hypothetical protein [Thermoplasmata archaeon]
MTDLASVADPGLMVRFRAAGADLRWREEVTAVGGKKPKRPAPDRIRIAHLHDEEARILDRADGSMVVDSGPVGALVLLLEIDRRGTPSRLCARLAGELPGFGQGALEAGWGATPPVKGPTLPMKDVVALARYALA